ncbi:MAG: TerC/Alx family metal homeostasis membrane protein [Pseudoclavibacter sp.]
MTQLPAWFEITASVVMVLILLADMLLILKRPHVPSMKESTAWVVFYVALALVFAGVLFWIGDADHGGQFLAGWLTEYSLSIDNLFVFMVLIARFRVPSRQQQLVLMAGILVALVLRGVFILLGASLIETFSWIFYLFGAYLIYTAVKQAFGSDDADEDRQEGALERSLRRRLRVADQWNGSHFRVTIDEVRYWTPLLVVLLALGGTDLLFALDSIPAIFGITQSPFLVFSANVFALMGLRQLYFLLGGLVRKLVYLKYGIAAILAFIGVKLVGHAMHANELPFINGGKSIPWAPEIGTWTSLAFILAAMGVATVASLIKVRRERTE